MVGGVRTVPITSCSEFKLYYLLLTSISSFIQIGPKLAKLVFWGDLGGDYAGQVTAFFPD